MDRLAGSRSRASDGTVGTGTGEARTVSGNPNQQAVPMRQYPDRRNLARRPRFVWTHTNGAWSS